jgi:FkbM family methyltransferase
VIAMSVDITDYAYGKLMYLTTDVYMGRMLRDHHQYSEGEVRLFRQILTAGDIVFEVGANIGVHTVPIAQMVGSDGAVFALEPQLKLYYMLCGNLALNNLDNVNALNMAASDATEPMIVPDVDYDLPNNFGGLSLRPPGSQGRQVNTICLDNTIGMLSRLKLLKVDVEGMELQVLRGATQIVKKFRPFLYVENDRPKQSEELLSFMMRKLEYRLYWHIPAYVVGENLPPEFVDMRSLNVLGVPSESPTVVRDLQEITDPKIGFA